MAHWPAHNAVRVLRICWPDAVDDDLLHRHVHVKVEQPVPLPCFQAQLVVLGKKANRSWMVGLEVLDDDAGLGHHPSVLAVMQHRNLAHRPAGQMRGSRALVIEVHRLWCEGRSVLVERDQYLVAERGERMEVERERHR